MLEKYFKLVELSFKLKNFNACKYFLMQVENEIEKLNNKVTEYYQLLYIEEVLNGKQD